MNCELPDVQAGFRKSRGTKGTKLSTSSASSKKQERFRKTSTFALLSMSKPLTVWITTNCGRFLKRCLSYRSKKEKRIRFGNNIFKNYVWIPITYSTAIHWELMFPVRSRRDQNKVSRHFFQNEWVRFNGVLQKERDTRKHLVLCIIMVI